jgi:hypothetical protein
MLVLEGGQTSYALVDARAMDGAARVAIEKNPRDTTVSFQTLTGIHRGLAEAAD